MPSGSVRLEVPASWGELAVSAAWEAEVQWVHTNRGRCISWSTQGVPKINLFLARTAAPSEGSLGLMQRAADDPKGFDTILYTVKKGAADEEGDNKRAERRAIKEIRAILAKFVEG